MPPPAPVMTIVLVLQVHGRGTYATKATMVSSITWRRSGPHGSGMRIGDVHPGLGVLPGEVAHLVGRRP